MNLDKYKTGRQKPSQARGKERVRAILAAALKEFKSNGLEGVTTNEIAKSAGVPIGSLYRYYPNKDAIINALVDLYANEVAEIFDDISRRPDMNELSWETVIQLILNSWNDYSRLNGPFDFLNIVRATPRLNQQNGYAWKKIYDSFCKVIKSRCPDVTAVEQRICIELTIAAARLGLSPGFSLRDQKLLGQDAVSVVANYMQHSCERHSKTKSV
jgi:AcrR family transcriptional regulator